MGTDEPEMQSMPEKSSSPVQEKTNTHPYPNWAAMQAYYGPGVALPPPYFNSAVTSAHPPHAYMWGTPQPMLSPYGTPYAAIYSHGGVYSHPPVPLGAHSQGHGNSTSPTASEPLAATPLTIATPAKSSSNKDQGFLKKLKGLNRLAVSTGNGNSGSSAASQSGDCRTEGSSDGSGDNTSEGGDHVQRKRSSEGIPSTGKDRKAGKHAFPAFNGEASATSSMSLGGNVASAGVADKTAGTETSPGAKEKTTAVTFSTPPGAEVSSHNGLASGLWIKDERELKREKRKQSNRESARRSRLRKQAETEELAMKVETLNAENLALRSEVNQLKENSEKLRLENDALTAKLKIPQGAEEMISNSIEAQGPKRVSTENFLSRVDNPLSNPIGSQRESETHENPKSGAKLHQLLDSSPRADAVAAG